jgi:hypothetical protein
VPTNEDTLVFMMEEPRASIGVLRMLLDAGVEAPTELLETACRRSDPELIRLLLDAGVTASTLALSIECKKFKPDPDVIQLLLAAGAPLDERTLKVIMGNIVFVRSFLDAGCTANTDALNIACAQYQIEPDVVRLLLEAGAQPDSVTLERLFCRFDNEVYHDPPRQREALQLILNAGIPMNDETLGRALACTTDINIVRLLLQAGVRATAYALDAACKKASELEKTCRIYCYTHACRAACVRHKYDPDIVRMLLQAGAMMTDRAR